MATLNDAREATLMPKGIPKYVRCYDNGGSTADRYTVVFTGRYRRSSREDFIYLGMSDDPSYPQGVGMHGTSVDQIDVNSKGWAPAVGRTNHLGKRVLFTDLPEKCQKLVLQTYKSVWKLG